MESNKMGTIWCLNFLTHRKMIFKNLIIQIKMETNQVKGSTMESVGNKMIYKQKKSQENKHVKKD